MVSSSLLFGMCLSDDCNKLASVLTEELGGNFMHKEFTLEVLLSVVFDAPGKLLL